MSHRGSASLPPLASTADFERELESLRHRVDSIDTQLLGLLNARAAVVADIYSLKNRHGIMRLDRSRSDAILDRLAAANAGPLHSADVRAIFDSLLTFFVERYAPPADPSEGGVAGNRGLP